MSSGRELFDRFRSGGFAALVNDEPRVLVEYLEYLAGETGEATSLFMAEAVKKVDRLFRDHDEYGGIRMGFIRRLDQLIHVHFSSENQSIPTRAELARRGRDEIIREVRSYNPRNDYES
jgi:hypothetical protein